MYCQQIIKEAFIRKNVNSYSKVWKVWQISFFSGHFSGCSHNWKKKIYFFSVSDYEHLRKKKKRKIHHSIASKKLQNIFDIGRRISSFSSQVWWTNKQKTRFGWGCLVIFQGNKNKTWKNDWLTGTPSYSFQNFFFLISFVFSV